MRGGEIRVGGSGVERRGRGCRQRGEESVEIRKGEGVERGEDGVERGGRGC